jgi:hypothetical protein
LTRRALDPAESLAGFVLLFVALFFSGGRAAAQQSNTAAIDELVRNAQPELAGIAVPRAAQFAAGNHDVAEGTTTAGPLAVAGDVRIAGTVRGDVFSYGGDVIVLPTGHVTGSVVALNGSVRFEGEGGVVDGDMRAVAGAVNAAAPGAPASAMMHNAALALGWAGVVLVIGIGVLVFGGRALETIGAVADQQFGRSFLTGVLATLAIAPVLAVGIIGLVLTIIGILLVPFAIVAYVLAVVGIVTLGFVAVVRMMGGALSGRREIGGRGASLRALVVGTVVFGALWLLMAVASGAPVVGPAVRVVVFGLTWAAATLGLGATVLSRAGSRRTAAQGPRTPEPVRTPIGEPAPSVAMAVSTWETPTPVTGVVAARRPGTTRSAGKTEDHA